MKNYKTTLFALLAAICIGVYPIIQTGIIDWNKVLMAAFIALVGFFAKDNNVTGGSVKQ